MGGVLKLLFLFLELFPGDLVALGLHIEGRFIVQDIILDLGLSLLIELDFFPHLAHHPILTLL